MANTRILIFYIFFLVIFSFLVTSFSVDSSGDDLSITKYAIVSKVMSKLSNADNLLASVIKVVLVPFLLIDILLVVLTMVTYTFIIVPPVINILIFTPLGIIITIDYIAPMIRGN